MSDDWQADAACAGMAYLDFTNERADDYQIETCMKVCDNCPVRSACLNAALADPNTTGVWGGTTPQQRIQLRRRTTLADGAPCGTPAAAARHARRGEPLDEACRKARSADVIDRRKRRNAA